MSNSTTNVGNTLSRVFPLALKLKTRLPQIIETAKALQEQKVQEEQAAELRRNALRAYFSAGQGNAPFQSKLTYQEHSDLWKEFESKPSVPFLQRLFAIDNEFIDGLRGIIFHTFDKTNGPSKLAIKSFLETLGTNDLEELLHGKLGWDFSHRNYQTSQWIGKTLGSRIDAQHIADVLLTRLENLDKDKLDAEQIVNPVLREERIKSLTNEKQIKAIKFMLIGLIGEARTRLNIMPYVNYLVKSGDYCANETLETLAQLGNHAEYLRAVVADPKTNKYGVAACAKGIHSVSANELSTMLIGHLNDKEMSGILEALSKVNGFQTALSTLVANPKENSELRTAILKALVLVNREREFKNFPALMKEILSKLTDLPTLLSPEVLQEKILQNKYSHSLLNLLIGALNIDTLVQWATTEESDTLRENAGHILSNAESQLISLYSERPPSFEWLNKALSAVA